MAIWYIVWPLEDLAMEDVGKFSAYLLYFTSICLFYFMEIWEYFSRFGMLYKEKSGNPGTHEY
jgi:hypothetical protein